MLQNFPYYAQIMLHCTLFCSIMLHKFIKFLLPESENKPFFRILKLLKLLASLENYLTVLLEYIDLNMTLFKYVPVRDVESCLTLAHVTTIYVANNDRIITTAQ